MAEQKKVELTEEQKQAVAVTLENQNRCQCQDCLERAYEIAAAVLSMPEAPTERRWRPTQKQCLEMENIYRNAEETEEAFLAITEYVRSRLLAPKPVESVTESKVADILARNSHRVLDMKLRNALAVEIVTRVRAELAKQEGA